MRRATGRFLLILRGLCCSGIIYFAAPLAAANAAAKLEVDTSAPQGFESLQTPRNTQVTLYYGGELVGHLPARFTPSTLQFTNPEPILAAIPAITQKNIIASALASPLPSNPDRICGNKPREGCGQLTPQTVGVIFDENTLTAELFIHRDYLAVQEQNAARFLPLPARNFSSVIRFDGAVSGTDQTTPAYALSGQNIYAFGEGNLTTRTTLSNEGLRFDTVSAEVERAGWSASGGLIRSLPMQLAGDRDIAGVSVSTSLRTRLDVRKTEGNELIVYLPRQSFISIYREGRLYSSRTYEAGNQRLDTTELPDGAYNVTLKIQEVGGVMREETRFFAKSEQIPPPDAPTYYLQAGVLREPFASDSTLPSLTSEPILRAGTVHRVAENIGVGASVLGISDRVAAETSAFMISGQAQLRASALASSAGDYGLQVNSLYIDPKWSAAIDVRRLWSSDQVPVAYSGIISELTQATGSFTYLLSPTLDATLRGNYYAAPGMPSVTSFGPAVNWRIWQEGESMLSASADAARINGDLQSTVQMRFTYRFGNYGVSTEGGYGSGRGAPGAFGTGRVWRNTSSPDESLLIGGGVRHDAQSDSINAEADWRGPMGRVRAAAQRSFGAGSITNYGGTFSTGIAQAEDTVALGGSESDTSAVIVEAEGEAGAPLTVFVNGAPRGTLEAGRRRVLYLAPYMSYRVRLAPSKGSMVNVEGGEQKVTLYPGNVAHLNWQVAPFTVIVAQITDANGAPLKQATVTTHRTSVMTDDNGRIQAEIPASESLIFTDDEAQQCRVTLPKIAPVNGVFLYREPLRCLP